MMARSPQKPRGNHDQKSKHINCQLAMFEMRDNKGPRVTRVLDLEHRHDDLSPIAIETT